MKRIMISLGLLVGLSACQHMSSVDVAPTPLHGLVFADKGVEVTVSSNGCTRKDDFSVYHDRFEAMSFVQIQRHKHDGCRRKRLPKTLLFTWQDLGIEKGQAFTLSNPLQPFTPQRFE